MPAWTSQLVAGGNLVLCERSSFPLLYTRDGTYAVVALAHLLRLYFLQTRQCTHTVDVDLEDATGMYLDPSNEHQVIVVSPQKIQHINFWNRATSGVVATQPLQEAIGDVFKVTETHYYALRTDISARTTAVVAVDRESVDQTVLFKTTAGITATSPQGNLLAVAGDLMLTIYDILPVYEPSESTQKLVALSGREYAHGGRDIQSMVVTSTGTAVVGFHSGAISVIHGSSDSGALPARPLRTLKWHLEPVKALALSADERYFVSGGAEKVLVFWHIELDRRHTLPRLAGPIVAIHVDQNRPDHYGVILQTGSAQEVVAISAVDLVSRLAYSPPKIGRRTPGDEEDPSEKLLELHDASIIAPAVRPSLRHVFFPQGADIQAFDLARGEQAYVQHVVPQVSMGRVRSEFRVKDPEVSAIAFSRSGTWLASVDHVATSDFDRLLSKNDTAYALKFWNVRGQWELATKIVDPHGPGVAVAAVVAGPHETFYTVDVRGGVKIWNKRNPEAGNAKTIWQAITVSAPTNGGLSAPGLYAAAAFSGDDSMLFVALGNRIICLDPESLRPIDVAVPSMDTPVRRLAVVGVHLVAVAASRMYSFDLVRGRTTELQLKLQQAGAANLVAVDTEHQVIAVAGNYVHNGALRSRFAVFKPHSLLPVYRASYDSPVSAVVASTSGFLVIDSNSAIRAVSPAAQAADADYLTAEMERLLVKEQATASILHAASVEHGGQIDDSDQVSTPTQKYIDLNTVLPVFANPGGLTLESIFELVVKAVQ